MLVMKAWLETRWRVAGCFAYSFLVLALNYQNRHDPQPARVTGMLFPLLMVLTCAALTLAGSGVRSQAPAGFPDGLAESTEFTIALPVSRLRLLGVRAAVGLGETFAATVIVAALAWILFPSVRAIAAPADFARLVSFTLLWLTAPYCAALFFVTLLAEPLSFMCAGWALTLLVWLLHRAPPAVDLVRAIGPQSPLVTHRLPWPQMAACAGLALLLFWAAARVVRTREY